MTEKINNDVKDAMKAKDKFTLSVLRMLKSAILNKEIDNKSPLKDEEVVAIIKKQVKMRRDSINEFTKYGKLEECEVVNKEIEILLAYLPQEATEEEIEKFVTEMFLEIKPAGPQDMGKCMKYASANIKNADMTKVSAIIKQKLN